MWAILSPAVGRKQEAKLGGVNIKVGWPESPHTLSHISLPGPFYPFPHFFISLPYFTFAFFMPPLFNPLFLQALMKIFNKPLLSDKGPPSQILCQKNLKFSRPGIIVSSLSTLAFVVQDSSTYTSHSRQPLCLKWGTAPKGCCTGSHRAKSCRF